MRVGDRVIYKSNPVLYGAMDVVRVVGRRVECRSAFRALAWPKNALEIFDEDELAPAPDGASPQPDDGKGSE